jgi:tetratricopeptide (TPR) repeat protein
MKSLFRRRPNLLQAATGRAELGFLLQKARLAQRRKDWPSALALWRKCVEKAPGDRTAALGYISVLIYGGDIEQASVRAEAFVRQHPKDGNGPMALGRVAEARGDFARAVDYWRAALALEPGKLQALIRLGAALLAEGRVEEAEACAANLESRHSGQLHGAILRAQIAQQAQGFAAAAPLWKAAADQFSGDAHVLRAYGRALLTAAAYEECESIAAQLRRVDPYESLRLRGQVLAKRAPYQDHTAFWKEACAELPDNVDFTRKLLNAALWARRLQEAEAAFGRLLAQKQLRGGDADFVIGLGHAYLESRNKAAVRAAVRAYLKGMRGRLDYRAAALRLHRLILACFPSRRENAIRISRTSNRFLKMVHVGRLGSGAADALERIMRLEDALTKSGATCLFDTDIDPESCRAFIRVVRDRLANRRPFSLIRLGDGEANALTYELSFAHRFADDAVAREKIWWGRTLAPQARAQLAARVHAAAGRSDALGFPTREWLLRDVRLDSGQPLSKTKTGRGLLAITSELEAAIASGSLPGRILVSAHIAQDLHRWNLYGDLLEDAGEVVVVSCHPQVPEAMRNRFGAHVVKHVLVPPGDATLEMQHRHLDDSEVPPASVDRALEQLGEWPRSRLVLVGAGYAGKVIVDEAHQRGGVALDLGSIFDRWVGLNTRSYQDIA